MKKILDVLKSAAKKSNLCPNMAKEMNLDDEDVARGQDLRFCAKCGREYDALAGECPFCAEGQPAEFEE